MQKVKLFLTLYSLLNIYLKVNCVGLIHPNNDQLGGLPAPLLHGETDMTRLCGKYDCLKFIGALNYSYTCSSIFYCGRCTPNLNVSDYCERVEPPTSDTLILASGFFKSNNVLSRKLLGRDTRKMKMKIEWGSSNDEPIDIKLCSIKDIEYPSVTELEEPPLKTYNKLNIRLVFMITVEKEKSELIKSNLKFDIFFRSDNELNSINNLFSKRRRCPRTAFKFELGGNSLNLRRYENVHIINSISIPYNYEYPISENDFEVVVTCKSLKNCNLSYYKFCIRLLCRQKSAEDNFQIALLEEKILYPTKLKRSSTEPKPLPRSQENTSVILNSFNTGESDLNTIQRHYEDESSDSYES